MKKKALIFIVDDIEDNVTILENQLVHEGYRVSFSSNGVEALVLIRDVHPDLVLLDVVMPQMDGYEVCRQLKSNPETKDIPVIFLTGQTLDPIEKIKGFEAGGADYLYKPYNKRELLARVKVHVELRQANEMLRQSEERYRRMVEDQAELVCRFYPEGVITYGNITYQQFFGKSLKELVGQSFSDILPEENKKEFLQVIQSLHPRHSVEMIEHPVTNHHGGTCWVQWTIRGFFDGKGVLTELQGVGRDITERVHLEEAYRSIVNYSHEGIEIWQNRRCIFSNPAVTEISGYTNKERMQLTFDKAFETVHPGDRTKIQTIFEKLEKESPTEKKTANPIRLQARFIKKNGELAWLDIYAVNTMFHGKPSIQFTFIDATRTKELENILDARKGFHQMIGSSKPMQRVYTLIEQFAETDLTVLVSGETGTGKELVAEAIHTHSLRADKPLVKVNCAAIPQSLIESELFGYEKGAFTGADKSHPGYFLQAEGGSLFLDEITEIPLATQAKLLRVLGYGDYKRLGGAKTMTADVRIIASTNRDPKQFLHDRSFREDLYFRLNRGSIHLPKLKDRVEDIRPLVELFHCSFYKKHKKMKIRIPEEIFTFLNRYQWPGNVRELKNVVEYALSVCQSHTLSFENLPTYLTMLRSENPLGQLMDSEKEIILNALEKTKWHKSKAATLLGISRSTLYRKIEELNIGN